MLLLFRQNNQIICRMNPLNNTSFINVSQPVEIFWKDPDLQDKMMDVFFTFKDDAEVLYMQPNSTIAR